MPVESKFSKYYIFILFRLTEKGDNRFENNEVQLRGNTSLPSKYAQKQQR